jgi:transposase-like protein
MKCPRCNSNDIRKSGFVGKRPRSYCKVCQFHYTVNARKQKPMSYKRLAIELHLEGLSNREIKKVLSVSDVAILNWLKAYKNDIDSIKDKPKRSYITDIKGIKKMVEDKCSLVLIKITDQRNDIYVVK